MATLEKAGRNTLRGSPETTATGVFYFILLNKDLPMLTILNVLTFCTNIIFLRGSSTRNCFPLKKFFFQASLKDFVLFLKCKKCFWP